MVESICGQSYAYAHEVEEDWEKYLVKLEQKEATGKIARGMETNQKSAHVLVRSLPFIAGVPWSRGQSYCLNYRKTGGPILHR
jgi:hypothetical protein